MKKQKATEQTAVTWLTTANWLDFCAGVGTYSEADIWAMLQHEGSTYKRKSYLIRLHDRYNVLRRQRERAQLIDLANTAHGVH